MERIIHKIARIFSKKYFLVAFVFTILIAVLGYTYSFWAIESGWKLASELEFRELFYTLSTNEISVPASSGTTYQDVTITSLNEINTKYLLSYNSSSQDITVKVSSLSENSTNGIIGLYENGDEAQKIVRLAIINNSNVAGTVTINVTGGYTWNQASEISIPAGDTAINSINYEASVTNNLPLAEEVNEVLNCTPTATSPCLFQENSNNYLTYSGKTWRILGTYLIGGVSTVKIILNEPLDTLTTYGDIASQLTTFYDTLDVNLIRTSSPFTCTGTSSISCTGSANIGILSKSEYDLIGGVNSYLYTKPNKNYWTNTTSEADVYYVGTSRGASTLAVTSTAYVRPVVYLNNSAMSGAQGSSYTLTNLVTNGSFENGTNNWTNYVPVAYDIATSTVQKISGLNSLLRTATTSVAENNPIYQVVETIAGHKYYVSSYTWHNVASQDTLTRMNLSPIDNWDWLTPYSTSGAANTWVRHSFIYNNSDYDSLKLCINQGGSTANTIGDYYYADDVTMVDLTAAFGAGNEPSKEWCDDNIDYFDGTTIHSFKLGSTTIGTSSNPYSATRGYQLTVNLNGGSSLLKSGLYASGETYSFAKPKKKYHELTSWTITGAGTTATPTSLTMGTANSSLSANWLFNAINLTVNMNGGTPSTAFDPIYDAESSIDLPSVTKIGYILSSWSVSGNATISDGKLVFGPNPNGTNSDATLTANWTPITYTVTYNCGTGSTGTTASSTHTYDASKALTASGCKKVVAGSNGTGMVYKFNGWAVAATPTVVTYTNSQSVLNLSSTQGATVTLTAVYDAFFSYSGTYTVVDDGSGNWRIKFLEGGTFIPYDSLLIDVFVVGGGGAGGRSADNGTKSGGGGGGGGKTSLASPGALTIGQSYTIIVGAGGAPNKANSGYGGAGGASSAFGASATGGTGGYGCVGNADNHAGGTGGNAGGVGRAGAGYPGKSYGETQGSSTCEFEQGTTSTCNSGVTAYAGGGGGGGGNGGAGGAGGAGGGGAGTSAGGCAGTAGTANTGGGGGGAYAKSVCYGGAGGTGIVIIRNRR